MSAVDAPVIIVGGGPVGLLSGLLLAKQGVASIILERRGEILDAPRAHAANPRTLEICRALGIAWEDIAARATRREDGQWVRIMSRLNGEEYGKLPFERQDDDVLTLTPTPLVNISQPEFETLLADVVAVEPRIDFRRQQQWESLDQDEDGVTISVRNLDDDNVGTLRGRYLLAADGAGSRIRKALDIEMIGPAVLDNFVMIHFEADLRPLVGDRGAILYWILEQDPGGVFIAYDVGRTWVLMHPFNPDEVPLDHFTEEVCTDIVYRTIGTDEYPVTVRNISPWVMGAQVAESYRQGRVFLVGDAAHRFPPTGGLGLNTGAGDAYNIAWKIAAVEQGWAAPVLLDSYDVERRPTAQENTFQSVANAGKVIEMMDAYVPGDGASAEQAREEMRTAIEHQRQHFDMLGVHLGYKYAQGAVATEDAERGLAPSTVSTYVPTTAIGASLPHAWVERDRSRVSTLDLCAIDRPTLICGPEAEAWQSAATSLELPIRIVTEGRDFTDPDGAWARVREVADDGAILVRPDLHVAWRSDVVGGDLAAAVQQIFGRVNAPSHA